MLFSELDAVGSPASPVQLPSSLLSLLSGPGGWRERMRSPRPWPTRPWPDHVAGAWSLQSPNHTALVRQLDPEPSFSPNAFCSRQSTREDAPACADTLQL